MPAAHHSWFDMALSAKLYLHIAINILIAVSHSSLLQQPQRISQGVGLAGGLILAPAGDAGEAHGDAALMAA